MIKTYEVQVEVEKKGTERCRPITYCGSDKNKRKPIYMCVAEKIVKMFHVEARSPKQAVRYAEKYGRPLSVQKINLDAILGNIESLKLDQPFNPYENAIAQDEFIWKKKSRRNNSHNPIDNK